ncbi:hypothetical protein SAMN05216413_2495 [Ruminococcaceae bacterium KH2T8]|nr:hypothetical protein SAMN05216413_2495 [Ruminococcaceae bacterium KH2T8]
MSSENPFTKDNLDRYLKALAKEYRKLNGKGVPAEITLIGGVSVLINYDFREMTYDMDAIIHASSSMKDAIAHIGDRFGLPTGWMNEDFKNTASYTPKIEQYSKYYRTYSNIVTFRTVSEEYLIAMKMRSGRNYKFDRSDIIGILKAQEEKGDPITLDKIKRAVTELYGSYEIIDKDIRELVEQALSTKEYVKLYTLIRCNELDNKNILIEYHETKPEVITKDNVDEILEILRKKRNDN